MSDENNELQEDLQKPHEDIDDLQSKYHALHQAVSQLENKKTSINSDIQQIRNEFEQMNTSMGEILQKLTKLSDDFVLANEKPDQEYKMMNSIRKMFTNPIRKMAVGTLSTVYMMTDKTIERTSSMKENLEDLVAEAKYENQKKKMGSIENS